MAKPTGKPQIVLSLAARQDMRDVLSWNLDKFSGNAAARYRTLLIQALQHVQADPLRPGSKSRPELSEGARTYHLALSRSSVEGQAVKTPRHFILYRISPTGVEVARILHDSRDLARHSPVATG